MSFNVNDDLIFVNMSRWLPKSNGMFVMLKFQRSVCAKFWSLLKIEYLKKVMAWLPNRVPHGVYQTSNTWAHIKVALIGRGTRLIAWYNAYWSQIDSMRHTYDKKKKLKKNLKKKKREKEEEVRDRYQGGCVGRNIIKLKIWFTK